MGPKILEHVESKEIVGLYYCGFNFSHICYIIAWLLLVDLKVMNDRFLKKVSREDGRRKKGYCRSCKQKVKGFMEPSIELEN